MSVFTARPQHRRRGFPIGRLLIAGVIALVSVITYFSRTSVNPVTGQKQRLALDVNQEIAMGLQAAPEMAAQFGGMDPDPRKQELIDEVGGRIVAAIPKAAEVYPFDFHVLADTQTVNAFALPGGQVFITAALFDRLQTEGQLAGVLSHEVGHVIQRHSAQRIAEDQLRQGLVGAVAVGAYDPQDGSGRGVAMAAAVAAQMIGLRYSRKDEIESDTTGVAYMADAGYDPRAMITVMEILKEAGGGSRTPEFFATHPDPGNREEEIERAIKEKFPGGVPHGLEE